MSGPELQVRSIYHFQLLDLLYGYYLRDLLVFNLALTTLPGVCINPNSGRIILSASRTSIRIHNPDPPEGTGLVRVRRWLRGYNAKNCSNQHPWGGHADRSHGSLFRGHCRGADAGISGKCRDAVGILVYRQYRLSLPDRNQTFRQME